MIRTTDFCGTSFKNIDEQDLCKCAPAIDEKVAVKAESCFLVQLVDPRTVKD